MNELIYAGLACVAILALLFFIVSVVVLAQNKTLTKISDGWRKQVGERIEQINGQNKKIKDYEMAIQSYVDSMRKAGDEITRLKSSLDNYAKCHGECVQTIDRIRTDHSNEIRRLAATIREIEFDRNQFRDSVGNLNSNNFLLIDRLTHTLTALDKMKHIGVGKETLKNISQIKKGIDDTFLVISKPKASDGGCFTGSSGKASNQVAKNYVDLSARTIDKNGPKQTACFSRAGVDIIVEVSEIARPIPRPQSSDECKAATLLTH